MISSTKTIEHVGLGTFSDENVQRASERRGTVGSLHLSQTTIPSVENYSCLQEQLFGCENNFGSNSGFGQAQSHSRSDNSHATTPRDTTRLNSTCPVRHRATSRCRIRMCASSSSSRLATHCRTRGRMKTVRAADDARMADQATQAAANAVAVDLHVSVAM